MIRVSIFPYLVELRLYVGVGVVKVHGKIYVVGGRNNSPDAAHQDSPAVDCFDPRSNRWSPCADMTVARNRVGVAVLDCLVYAVGGSDQQTHHSSVERYCTRLHLGILSLTPSTPAVPNCCCSKGPAPYWSNPPFLIFDIRSLWRSVLSARATECQKLKMVG